MKGPSASTHVTLPWTSGKYLTALCIRQALCLLGTLGPWLFVALLFSTLIAPVAAFDEEAYALAQTSARHGYYHLAHRPAGVFLQFYFLIGGVATTISNNMLGPAMGITSVLWLMMRNDPAIDPRVSWMIFGAWSFFTSAYFTVQCRRVYNHRLYIFLSIALASMCMCVIALVQHASLQSGLVTVIPPCISFAAYIVAYFFPDHLYINEGFEV